MSPTDQLPATPILDSQDTLDTQSGTNTQQLAQPVFLERDREWEAELLGHLSELEQRLREFSRSRFAADPHATVSAAVRMVQELDTYAAGQAERASLVRAQLPETRKIAGQYILKAESLARPLPPRRIFGVPIGSPRLTAAQRQNCGQVLRELPAAVEAYLLVLGNGFATGPMAAKWVETSGVFNRQLNKLVVHITE
jgi:hypothetical protein